MSASHGRRNQSGGSSFLQFWFSGRSSGLEIRNLDTSPDLPQVHPTKKIASFHF